MRAKVAEQQSLASAWPLTAVPVPHCWAEPRILFPLRCLCAQIRVCAFLWDQATNLLPPTFRKTLLCPKSMLRCASCPQAPLFCPERTHNRDCDHKRTPTPHNAMPTCSFLVAASAARCRRASLSILALSTPASYSRFCERSEGVGGCDGGMHPV
jgi:hypothetical protein